MDGVGTPIIGRPRPLPGHDTPNPAYHPHTLNYEEPGKVAGDGAAQWLIENSKKYGISYIIWQGRIWEPDKGWYAYDGAGGIYDPSDCAGGHYDHIHVSVF